MGAKTTQRSTGLMVYALLTALNCASPTPLEHPALPRANAAAAPSANVVPVNSASSGPAIQDAAAVTFYQITTDAEVEPVWLGERTVLRHLRDGQALAELRGNEFVIDPKLATGIARCSSSPAWTFFGEFPDRAFALVDWLPHSTRDRGPLLRWDGTQWQLVRLLMAHDVLASVIGDELLVLRDRLTTSPPGAEYAFDDTRHAGALGRPYSKPLRALIADDQRVLVLGSNEHGFYAEQWRGERGVSGHSPLTPAPAELSALAHRSQSDIWLAAVDANGASYLVHGTDAGWQRFESLPGRVVSMVLRPEGDLWLLAETAAGAELLRRTRDGELVIVQLAETVGPPRKLWLGHDGDIWLAANGLYSTRRLARTFTWNLSTPCAPKAPAPQLSKVLALPCVEPLADAEARVKRAFGRHAKLASFSPLGFSDLDNDGVPDTVVPVRLSPTRVVDALYHYDAGCSRFLGLIFDYTQAWGPPASVHHLYEETSYPTVNGFDQVTASTSCAENCCSKTLLTVYQFDGAQYRRISTSPRYANCSGTDLF